MNRADVIVIGAGVMGAATARALAMNGHDVVIFERARVGHAGGSSHGSARIWRHSYKDPRYVRMMTDALPLWRALQDEAGEQLLSITGARNVGPGLEDLARAMLDGGAACEWIDDGGALLDPSAGVVSADRAWRALIDSALAHGARLHEGTEASVRAHGAEVEVAAGDRTWRARVAVITAGSWVGPVAAAAGVVVPVTVTSETVSYWRPSGPTGILIDWSEPLMYAVPTPEGWVKVGEHIAGPRVEPGDPRSPDPDSVARAEAWLGRRFPDLAFGFVSAETCLYTNAPDQAFILERHGPVVIGSPCSGHGFKFAPLIGATLARMAAD